jgi:Tfp pilus assembly protein PilO
MKLSGSFPAILASCLTLVLIILAVFFVVKVTGLKADVAAAQKQLAESKAVATKTQADWDKERAGSAELQAQAGKQKAQIAELQEQLGVAKSTTAQLQEQLTKATGASTELIAKSEADKGHFAELQSQLEQYTAASTQLQTQLNQAKIQAVDLQARLQKAEASLAEVQPMLLKTGHMPVTTSFEKARGGRSYNLSVGSHFTDPLSVDISVTASGKVRTQHNIIAAGATLVVDSLSLGEGVTILSQGYDPLRLVVQ